MKNRHWTTREPEGRHLKGWARLPDVERGIIYWRLWAQTKTGGLFAFWVSMTAAEIRSRGRIAAALLVRKARRDLRRAVAEYDNKMVTQESGWD